MTRRIKWVVCLILAAYIGMSTGIALVPDDIVKSGTVRGQINAKPRFMVERQQRQEVIVRTKRMDVVTERRIIQQIESLPQGVAESIGRRYNLNETVVKSLRESILDSITRALEDVDNLNVFAEAAAIGNVTLIEVLLSHPNSRRVFAEHLNETQLQDYLDFTAARRQRDQQAVAHRLTVSLDKELSFTAAQREKVVQLLLDATKNETFPTSMGILGISFQEAVNLVFYKLDISLDGVLSEAQSTVWQGLVDKGMNEKRNVIFIRPEKEIKGAIEFDLDEKGVEVLRGGILIEDSAAESEEQMKQIAAAKLIAHTELLGPLDARAARRLDLVTKGVVQQYIEVYGETRELIAQEFEADLMQKVEEGKMNREEAAMMLEFTVKKAMDEVWVDGDTVVKTTKHPLYQQTIKDVLSEDAFAKYSAYRSEREALRLQALRDVAVACVDTQLLLGDTQREQLETTALRLTPGRFGERKSTELLMFFQLFPQTMDFEILTSWQQGEFERVLSPFVWKK